MLTQAAAIIISDTPMQSAPAGRRDVAASHEQFSRFNRAAVARELRMIELKQELNEL